MAPVASTIQRELAAAGASSTTRVSASSAATVGGSWANSLLPSARRKTAKAADSAGSPSSSAAPMIAARASPGSNVCSNATATIASPRKSRAAPWPQPSARRRARTSEARSAARRSCGRSAVLEARGFPAPIAAAWAISSDARVAPVGATRAAAASTLSTDPFCVQSPDSTMGPTAQSSISFLNAVFRPISAVPR